MSHSRCRPVTLVGLSLATLALALLPGITARPVLRSGNGRYSPPTCRTRVVCGLDPTGICTSPKEVRVVSTRPMVSAIRSSLR